MAKLDPRSLSHFICDTLHVKYGTQQFKNLMSSTLLYICTSTNIKVYHRTLKDNADFSALDITPAQFRMELMDSGYVTANLKFYSTFLSLLTANALDKFVAEELCYKYKICPCDAKPIFNFILELKGFRTEIRKFAKSRGIKSRDYSFTRLQEIKDTFSSMLPELEKHIRRTTNKKLDFIRKYFNMSREELWSDLVVHTLRAYYKSVPNDFSELKQLNYLRTAVNNRALNLIESHVSQKRQRLVNMGSDNKEGAKFVLMVEAESQMTLNSEGESQSLETLGEGEFWLNGAESQDFTLSIDSLRSKYRNTKRGVVLSVFAGFEVPRLTTWMRKRRMLRAVDKNSQDIMETKDIGEMCSILAEFLNVKVDVIHTALGRFGHELGFLRCGGKADAC